MLPPKRKVLKVFGSGVMQYFLDSVNHANFMYIKPTIFQNLILFLSSAENNKKNSYSIYPLGEATIQPGSDH
jgi:hypothetical protein